MAKYRIKEKLEYFYPEERVLLFLWVSVTHCNGKLKSFKTLKGAINFIDEVKAARLCRRLTTSKVVWTN